ncbi:hypothetical protein BSO21_29155 [Paenibacillus odorifer]|uniref:Uncharacterized protein n=1 Tax=Paenibacillus odorifer TaxID=189426 RepID=A0ABX3GEV7_9BACL|nr:hypothetical protein BSO21_29155 [Paenibacillus odorifer]
MGVGATVGAGVTVAVGVGATVGVKVGVTVGATVAVGVEVAVPHTLMYFQTPSGPLRSGRSPCVHHLAS